MALRTRLSRRLRFIASWVRLENRITPAVDIGNTLSSSMELFSHQPGQFSTTDLIGDGLFPDRDVDMFKINAQPGLRITAVTSQPDGKATFDSILRLFDGNGNQVAFSDDYGAGKYSRLSFMVQTGLFYYLGVSGFNNKAYDPRVDGTGINGTKGDYQLSIDVRGEMAKWESQGPEVIRNGQVEGMAAQFNPVVGAVQVAVPDPGNVNRMWIGTVNGGIFRTVNATAANPTWVALTDSERSLSISDLDLDPSDPLRNTLVASVGKYSNLAVLRDLFVNNKRVLDGGELTGLLRTTDGGDSWVSIGGATLANRNISEVIARGKYIIAAEEINESPGATFTGGLYLSQDFGQTFVEITAGGGIAEDGPVFDIAADPGNAGRIYAAMFDTATAKGKLYRSDDYGVTWADKTGTLTFPAVPRQVRIAVHDSPMGNAVFFAAADKFVTDMYRSTDKGTTWTAMDRPEWGGFTLTAASNANPIQITSGEHNRSTGDIVVVSGVQGNTNANGRWTITKNNANQYTLNGVMGNAAYTGGGLIQLAVTNATQTNPITITTGGKHFLANNKRVQITGVGGNAAANGIFVVQNVTATTFDLFQADGVTSVDGTGGGAYVANTGAMKILTGVSPGTQTRTNLTLAADPTDPKFVYVGGDRQPGLNEILTGGTYAVDVFPNDMNAMTYSARLMRGDASLASGSQWEPITNQYADANQIGPGSSPHADSRCIVFDANGRMIQTDDSGIYARANPRAATGVWTSLIGSGLSISEFHSIAYDPLGNVVMAGSQDVGTSEQTAAGNTTWSQALRPDGVKYLTGDGNVVAIQVEGANTWRYGSFPNYGGMQRQQYDNVGKAVGAAQSANLTLGAGTMPGGSFYTPYVASATTAQALAFSSGGVLGGAAGNYHIFTSANRGATVTAVADPPGGLAHVYTLAYGGKTGGVVEAMTPLYVGAENGLFLSQAGGALAAVANYPGGWVADLALDPEEWKTLYLIDGAANSVRRVTNAPAAAAGDHVDVTGNANGGLADAGKLRTIAFFKGTDSGTVIVGADRGTYAMQTTAPGIWSRVAFGLPNAISADVHFDSTDNLLILGTIGRGAWSSTNFGANYDTANPTIVSITRGMPDPNSASALTYTVTFNEHVFGLTKAAFQTKSPDGKLTVGGMDVQSVTGSGKTYTVSVMPGGVIAPNLTGQLRLDLVTLAGITDIAGNPLKAGKVGEVYSINPDLPTALAATSNITIGGGTKYSFTVTYADNTAINAATLKTGNVTVTGPNGFNLTPVFKGVNIAGNGTPRIATYEFTPPNGAWSFAANGTYTISATGMAAHQVKDTAAVPNAVPANPVGNFNVDISASLIVDVANNVDNGNYAKGDLSLREAINLANLNIGVTDTITFDATVFATPQTIGLTGNQLKITDSVVIRGTSADNVIIDGNLMNEIFLLEGPGILNVTFDQLTLTKGKLAAFSGGAIYNNGEILTISNSRLTANQAFTGGAIVSANSGTVSLRNCSITGNTAAAGGALDMDGGKLTIESCTFSANSSTGVNGGGAILFRNTAVGGQVVLRNSTISGNVSATDGGGIRLYYFSGELLLQNCTIRNNTASGAGSFGGGIFLASPAGSVTVRSSIVSGNVNASHADISAAFSTVKASFSALGSNTGMPMFIDEGNNLPFSTALKLGPLANNGGFTQTHLPLPTSPVINAGANPAGLFVDQRGVGFPRESSPGKPDIGATEFVVAGLIQGRVFDDRDGDLTFTAGDVGLANRVVFLDSDNNGTLTFGEANTVTDANGIYEFISQPAGATTVRTQLPSGWTLLAPAGGGHAVTLPPGVAGRDFPQSRLNSITGFVYDDKNSSGAPDSGEPGLADVIVFLDLNRDGIWQPGKISATNLPVAIPDVTTTTSTLEISNFTGAVTDLNINFDISHTFDSDLKVSLTGPTGLTVVLFDGIGGTEDNFIDTTLDDQAAAVIGTGAAPFNGVYRPANLLAGFNGLDPNGTWTLTVQDKVASSSGTLNSWQLQFNNKGEHGAVTDASGRYALTKVSPGGYYLRHFLPAGYVVTTQPAGGTYLVNMAAGDVRTGNNFGDAKVGPAPRVNAIQRAGTDPNPGPAVAFTVTFSEPVLTLSAGNFSLVSTGTAAGVISSITGGPTIYTVNVGSVTGTGTLRLDMANSNMLVDGDGLPVGNVPFLGQTYAITGPSAPPTVAGVVINNGAIQRSMVTSLTVNFAQPVSFPFGAAAAFQLMRTGLGNPTGTVNVNVIPSSNSVTITFVSGGGVSVDPGGSLRDGRYQLTIVAANVMGSDSAPLDGNGDGIGGDNYTLVGTPSNGLFRLFGDNDGNGTVNSTDFLAFRLAFLSSSATFDFDGNGQVAAADFLQFRLRFLQSV